MVITFLLLTVSCSKKLVRNDQTSVAVDKVVNDSASYSVKGEHSQSSVMKMINKMKVLEKYKDASAVNVFTDISIDVNEDYTFSKQVFYVKKILNYQGKKRYSDVKINYNADFETVELGRCYVIDPEGKIIEIPENQIYDLNDRVSIMSPDYINRRDKIVNFPNIEIGYFLVMDYTLKSSRKRPFNEIVHMMENNPYIVKKLELRIPEKLDVRLMFDADRLQYSKSNQNGLITHQWEIENSDIIKNERNAPSYNFSGIPVAMSCYQSWSSFGNERLSVIRNLSGDAIIKELSLKLTKNAVDDKGKLLAIYKYMAANFTTKMSYSSQLEAKPLPLSEIMEKRYGSSRDLTALFYVLAKEAGVKDVYPALLLSSNERELAMQQKIPLDDFYNEICIWWQGKLIVPGNKSFPFCYAGFDKSNVVLGKDKAEFITYNRDSNFDTISDYQYVINGQNVEVTASAVLSGSANTNYRSRFLELPKEQRRIWFDRSLNDKSATLAAGPEFDSFDAIEKDLRVNYKLDYSDFIVNQNPYVYFNIKKSYFPLDVSSDERFNDFQVYSKIAKKDNFTIKGNKGYKLVNPVANRKIEFDCGKNGKAYYSFTSKQTGGEIKITREIYVPETIITKERYAEFKEFVSAIKNPINDMLFLEKAK